MAKRDPILHKGHRLRMKKQVLRDGLDGLSDHQIAEVMLFYSIPQGDTNELAHRLVNECGGTITGVINTPYKKLIKIKGIGEHTAYLIDFIRKFTQIYLKRSYMYSETGDGLKGAAELSEFFRRVFVGTEKEEIHAAAFSGNHDLIAEECIAEGSFSEVPVVPRRILDFAEKHGSSSIVLAHNHPSVSCLPSHDDAKVTEELVHHLAYFDIEVADHIVVGTDGVFSMRSSVYKERIW